MKLRKLLYCLFLFIQLCCCSLSQEQLHYALFSAGPSGGLTSVGVTAALEIAEERVNNDSSLLSNYTLTHTGVADTMCNQARTLELFFNAVSPSSPTILGLIGSGCSIASVLMAKIVSHYSISQISYTSSSLPESTAHSAPHFFQTVPSDTGFTPSIVSLCRFYGWERVGFLSQQGEIFAEAMEHFTRELRRANITIKNRELSQQRLRRRQNNTLFFEKDSYRVFFLNMDSSLARRVLCTAYRRGLTHHYVWITYGWYQDRWWSADVSSQRVECSDQEMVRQVDRALALQLLPEGHDPDAMTDTGLTLNQFNALYNKRLRSMSRNLLSTFGAPFAYDALWTLAFALDKASNIIASNRSLEEVVSLTGCNVTGSLVPLEKFSYDNELLGCVVRWCIEQTNFMGVTGAVKFDKEGSRVHSEVQVLQYRGNESSLVLEQFASIRDSTANISYVSNESSRTVFPGGVPSDGNPYTQTRTFYLELVIIIYSLSGIGLILCTACLIFNCTQRNKKVVRLTSPGLNYLILAGIYIFYVSLFFRVVPSTKYTINVARCSINIILTNLGYCLTFGTLLAKMGRVYYIFHNPSTTKKVLKDRHLAVIILVITGIGCLLGVLHVSVPQLRIDAILREDPGYGVGTDAGGVEVHYVTYQCGSEGGYGHIWLVLTYVYFGLLQLVGLILAIQTRKVQVKVLNDSKHVAALIYISSILLVLLAVVVLVFNSYINVSETVFSGAFLCAATIFACLIFIPKMVSLHRDPKGERIFEQTHRGTSVEGTLTGRSTHSVSHTIDEGQYDSVTIAQLQLRVRELERLLRENQMCSSGSDEGSASLDSTSHLVDSISPMIPPQSGDQHRAGELAT